MGNSEQKRTYAFLDKLIPILLDIPWMEVIAQAWEAARKLWQGMAGEGMYEVLEYESTLELKDEHGKTAYFSKRERVRYRQNNIIAFQDQGWADGRSLLNYRCSPGKAVDRYRLGRTNHILISLQAVKNRGDEDEFNIEWGMRNSFRGSTGRWETAVSHRTKQIEVKTIFPKNRPPLQLSLVESLRQRTLPVSRDGPVKLPDGRWLVTWKKRNPRLHERYVLQWNW